MSDPSPPISYTFEVPAYPQVFVPTARKPRPYWLHILLLLLIWEKPSRLLLGVPFSATLIGILLAHEFGHFFLAEKNRVHATLTYFIPAPTFIGTFGALIRIKSPIRSRQALFDIGSVT